MLQAFSAEHIGTGKAFNLIISKQGSQKAQGKGKPIEGKYWIWVKRLTGKMLAVGTILVDIQSI